MSRSIEKLNEEVAKYEAKLKEAKKEQRRLKAQMKRDEERKAREAEQREALEFYRMCKELTCKYGGENVTVYELAKDLERKKGTSETSTVPLNL